MTGTAFPEVLHLAAFAHGPGSGNMAGVVLGAAGLSDEQMLRTARELGYSETAFVTTALHASPAARIRYFSTGAEAPFVATQRWRRQLPLPKSMVQAHFPLPRPPVR